MRLLQYLTELWAGIKNNRYEILVNPSKKEIMSIDEGSGVRFTADSRDKKVYVWEVYMDIHRKAWKYIKPGEDEDKLSRKGILLEGTAEKEGREYRMISSDQLDEYFDLDGLKRFSKKFKWVNSYINIEDALSYWIELNS